MTRQVGGTVYRTPHAAGLIDLDRGPARSHRRRGGRWVRVLLILGVLLLLAAAGTVVGGKLLLAHYSKSIVHSGGLGRAAAKQQRTGVAIAGPINLLLVGIDERDGNAASGVRADSIILAHVTAAHDAVYFASVPRDSRVRIPADEATGYTGGIDKINAAFQFGYRNGGGRQGGLALLAETVSDLAGTGGTPLSFNGAAIVNFDGLQGLVRAIGGVHMYVDEKTTSIHIGQNTRTGREGVPYVIHSDGTVGPLRPYMKPQVYDVGWHDFTDWQALDYVRQRDLLANQDGDYGRQRHQQQFLKAVLEKATGTGVLANPLKAGDVLGSLGQAVSFYNNKVDLIDWIFTLKGISSDKVTMIKTNAGKFNSVDYGGVSYEQLSDDSLQLLGAIATDAVPGFLAGHPDWVST